MRVCRRACASQRNSVNAAHLAHLVWGATSRASPSRSTARDDHRCAPQATLTGRSACRQSRWQRRASVRRAATRDSARPDGRNSWNNAGCAVPKTAHSTATSNVRQGAYQGSSVFLQPAPLVPRPPRRPSFSQYRDRRWRCVVHGVDRRRAILGDRADAADETLRDRNASACAFSSCIASYRLSTFFPAESGQVPVRPCRWTVCGCHIDVFVRNSRDSPA